QIGVECCFLTQESRVLTSLEDSHEMQRGLCCSKTKTRGYPFLQVRENRRRFLPRRDHTGAATAQAGGPTVLRVSLLPSNLVEAIQVADLHHADILLPL